MMTLEEAMFEYADDERKFGNYSISYSNNKAYLYFAEHCQLAMYDFDENLLKFAFWPFIVGPALKNIAATFTDLSTFANERFGLEAWEFYACVTQYGRYVINAINPRTKERYVLSPDNRFLVCRKAAPVQKPVVTFEDLVVLL